MVAVGLKRGMDMKDLRDKAVLITGAAGGIGRAAALEFAREGAGPLLLNDVDEEGLAGTAGMVRMMGGEAATLPADVSDYKAVKDMVGEALDRVGRIDVLVNVAGIGIGGPMEVLEMKDWNKVLGVDLFGILHTFNQVYPHMLERGSGHIVNVASGAGLVVPSAYNAPYNTAKFGVVGFSESLLYEAGPRGIGVTCVCPGVVKTTIYETSAIKGFNPEAQGELMRIVAAGEEPEDTARAIVRAVKKNRFLVVTTVSMKVLYYSKRYAPFLWFPLMKAVCRGMIRYMNRYRTGA